MNYIIRSEYSALQATFNLLKFPHLTLRIQDFLVGSSTAQEKGSEVGRRIATPRYLLVDAATGEVFLNAARVLLEGVACLLDETRRREVARLFALERLLDLLGGDGALADVRLPDQELHAR